MSSEYIPYAMTFRRCSYVIVVNRLTPSPGHPKAIVLFTRRSLIAEPLRPVIVTIKRAFAPSHAG